jgi:g-D-glutamyl-meso-diaminopimelate peptidase
MFSSAENERRLRELSEKYPFVQLRQLTVTPGGRPVTAAKIGSGKHTVLVSAAHHANEWITAPLILQFLENYGAALEKSGEIGGADAMALAEGSTLWAVPLVNPDGVDLVTGGATEAEVAAARSLAENYPDIPFPDGWKADLQGVDLNLQYPAGWLQAREIKYMQGFTRPGPRDFVGAYPLSQRESRALAEFTEEIDPDLVLAYHTQGQEIYWQFEDIFVPGAEQLGREFADLSGYTLADTPYNSSFAGYKDWFIKFFRRPGYTIEAGIGENPLPIEQLPEIYADNLPILVRALQEN